MDNQINEKEFYRLKLSELELIKKQMIMANETDEEINEINKMIKMIKDEYAKLLINEKKEGKINARY